MSNRAAGAGRRDLGVSLRRVAFLAIAAVAGLGMIASGVDARPGGGGSSGSRGTRTFTAPPTTNTAPKTAAPIDRSITQPGAAASKGSTGAAAPAAAANQGSRFGGVRGLLMGGLFAAAFAGIFGIGALASALGFLLQFALIAAVVYFAWSFFRSRSATPQPAMARAGSAAPPPRRQPVDLDRRTAAGGLGGGAVPPLDLSPADFDAFEARLGAIQTAFGKGDLRALGDAATPEMLSYFAEELAANTSKGVRNEVSSAKLLQGDLAESWRESGGEYATVAMRYSVIDAMIDEASGLVVSGSRTTPGEVTELWTFRRPPGGSAAAWELSAIQQG